MPRPTLPIEGNIRFLLQGVQLIDQLTDAHYTHRAPGRSPVGAQFRHVLDHYACFLDGLDVGEVDYDQRRRDGAIETDRATAIAAAEGIIERLAGMEEGATVSTLRVRMNSGGTSADADHAPSTLGRELLFLVSHTVHHFAVIRLLLAEQGVDPGEEFGMAPSTLAHAAGH
jgi:uncharacterized damage-inducible protein DinB